MIAALAIVTGPLLAIASAIAAPRIGFEGQEQRLLAENNNNNLECNLPPVARPSDGLPSAQEILSGEDALLKQVERHAGIVKIPTISYDDNGDPGEDPRWDVFYELHKTFAHLYPHL